MTRPDRLDVPGTSNLRDVGGRTAGPGSWVMAGRLLRSEVVVAGEGHLQGVWASSNAAAFAALGLRTVIDLRAVDEVATVASAWGDATGARVVQLPIAEGGEGTDTDYVRQFISGARRSFRAEDMAAFYIEVLERRADVFAAAVRVLAASDALPAVVHCSAGKDRTGLLIALVLEVLGVPRDVVVDDYALTGSLRPNRVLDYAHLFHPEVRPEDVRVLFGAPPAAMELALAHLDAAHGGVTPYLVGAGVTPAELDALRMCLVVPVPVHGQGAR